MRIDSLEKQGDERSQAPYAAMAVTDPLQPTQATIAPGAADQGGAQLSSLPPIVAESVRCAIHR